MNNKLYSFKFKANDTDKEIAVFCNDIAMFNGHIDVLTTSAYVNSYEPTPKTVFRALYENGINVKELSTDPELDLRVPCHVWLSKRIRSGFIDIGRIGCVELLGRHLYNLDEHEAEETMINSIRTYFRMLDIASIYGVSISTVAMPLLGGGRQGISRDFLLIPLINECISFLKQNDSVKSIYFIERSKEKAERMKECLIKSLNLTSLSLSIPVEQQKRTAFISYSYDDKNIADNLCNKLESNGIKVWYGPRDIKGPYASEIVKAIDQCKYFIVILSQNSISSEHVLNEVDLAFQNIPNGLKFKPLKIDNSLFTPSFKYYLSRQHWMDASIPPLEERLNEFVADVLNSD